MSKISINAASKTNDYLKYAVKRLGHSSTSVSEDIFGEQIGSNLADPSKDDETIYAKGGILELAIPLVNHFTCNTDCRNLARILGIRSDDAMSVAAGKSLYSISRGEFLTQRKLNGIPFDEDDMLIGGDFFLWMAIESGFDINERIASLLQAEVNDFLFKYIEKARHEEMVYKHQLIELIKIDTTGDVWLIDNYFLTITNDDFKYLYDILKSHAEAKSFKLNLLKGRLNPFTLCCAFRDRGPNIVTKNILESLYILPVGYRPTIQGATDPLTKMYNLIINQNNVLMQNLTLPGTNSSDILSQYAMLVNNYRKALTVTSEETVGRVKYKSVYNQLGGKTGHIRGVMRGVRSDCTGRSVIISDPEMPIDMIGIPRKLLYYIWEADILREWCTREITLKDGRKIKRAAEDYFNGNNNKFRDACLKKLVNTKFVAAGRQPTLYNLGIQSFRVKIVEGSAIVLSPLICSVYNADFDGDQMLVFSAICEAAENELKNILYCMNNVYLTRNSECHIAPRHEIIYGLWKGQQAYDSDEEPYGQYSTRNRLSLQEAFEAIVERDIPACEVALLDGRRVSLGEVALRYCLSTYANIALGQYPMVESDGTNNTLVTEKWFKQILGEIRQDSVGIFKSVVNNLVTLGFAIAKQYPPSVSVLDTEVDIQKELDAFNKSVYEREELYNQGFETEETYASYFDQKYMEFEASVKKKLKASIGVNNGYKALALSGARGSESNLMQIFAMKGRMQKSSNEAFNVVLSKPLTEQLSGLEHFITAYGARQGMIDKSIETYKPGYFTNKMAHTTSRLHIVSDDCHTKNGIHLTFDYLAGFLSNKLKGVTESQANELVRSYFAELVVGRYVVEHDTMIKSVNTAKILYDNKVASIDSSGVIKKKDGVHLRSPITCEDPCCAKCYGLDLGTRKEVIVGTPVGVTSAYAIGEPSTQMTMKSFQKGGVAGSSNLISSFDIMNNYMSLTQIDDSLEKEFPIMYDKIAHCDARLVVQDWKEDGIVRIQPITTVQLKDGSYKEKNLNWWFLTTKGNEVKEFVKKGESVFKYPKYMHMQEVLEYKENGFAPAYLATLLYDLVSKEIDISPKHFEVIAASMIYYICTKSSIGGTFKTGLYYNIQEYWSASQNERDSAQFIQTMTGIKENYLYNNDILASMFMEDARKGIERSIMLSDGDTLTDPIVRTALGLKLEYGTSVNEYLEKRGSV